MLSSSSGSGLTTERLLGLMRKLQRAWSSLSSLSAMATASAREEPEAKYCQPRQQGVASLCFTHGNLTGSPLPFCRQNKFSRCGLSHFNCCCGPSLLPIFLPRSISLDVIFLSSSSPSPVYACFMASLPPSSFFVRFLLFPQGRF